MNQRDVPLPLSIIRNIKNSKKKKRENEPYKKKRKGNSASIQISKTERIEESKVAGSSGLQSSKQNKDIQERTSLALSQIEFNQRRNEILLKNQKARLKIIDSPLKKVRKFVSWKNTKVEISQSQLKAVKSSSNTHMIRNRYKKVKTKRERPRTLDDKDTIFFQKRYKELEGITTFPKTKEKKNWNNKSIRIKNSFNRTKDEKRRSASAWSKFEKSKKESKRLKTPLIGKRVQKPQETPKVIFFKNYFLIFFRNQQAGKEQKNLLGIICKKQETQKLKVMTVEREKENI